MANRYLSRFVTLSQQLEACKEWMMLLAVPGAGRGLVAAKDIPYGTVIHTEIPMVSTPSPHGVESTCYACLQPMPGDKGGSSNAAGPNIRFCSDACSSQAQDDWMRTERQCDFSALHDACREHGEKFPLLAARAACMAIERGLSEAPTSTAAGIGPSHSSASPPRGDVIKVSFRQTTEEPYGALQYTCKVERRAIIMLYCSLNAACSLLCSPGHGGAVLRQLSTAARGVGPHAFATTERPFRPASLCQRVQIRYSMVLLGDGPSPLELLQGGYCAAGGHEKRPCSAP